MFVVGVAGVLDDSNAPIPPAGTGRFGAGREGAVLLRSVTVCVSTADSTLIVGRGLSRMAIAAEAT